MKIAIKRISQGYNHYKGVMDAIKYLASMKKESGISEIKGVLKNIDNESIIIEGLYLNYPNSNYSDFYLSKTVSLLVLLLLRMI